MSGVILRRWKRSEERGESGKSMTVNWPKRDAFQRSIRPNSAQFQVWHSAECSLAGRWSPRGSIRESSIPWSESIIALNQLDDGSAGRSCADSKHETEQQKPAALWERKSRTVRTTAEASRSDVACLFVEAEPRSDWRIEQRRFGAQARGDSGVTKTAPRKSAIVAILCR